MFKMFGKKAKARWIKELEAEMLQDIPEEQKNVTTEDRIRGRTPEEVLKGYPTRRVRLWL